MRIRKQQRIEAYLDRLFGYAFSLTRNSDDSKDLVQDCALKALAARETPRDEAAYRAWLFRILRNAWIDRLRRPKLDETDLPLEWRSSDIEGWRGDERRITTLTVRLGLARLSPMQREVIALVDIVGLTYAEAAGVLGVPQGTIMSRLSRARRALLAIVAEGAEAESPQRLKRGATR